MTIEQIQALKNYPYPIVESLTFGAAKLRAAATVAKGVIEQNAEVARANIKQKLEEDLSNMRREYAQQVKEANRILAGEQEPYDIDHSMNQIL